MKEVIVIAVCVTLVIALDRDVRSGDPEVDMTTVELITSKGYPCEEYDVLTRDGYILSVQRIPYGINETHTGEARPVVLLWHPLLSSSACWVENLANESLAFLMADAGFDVWMANSRGNTYARRHSSLTTDDADFWDFSWDEMALEDLPATVDKVLSVTGASDLFYVGHSQGGAIGYAGLAASPELNKKVRMFAALAPAVHVKHMQSPVRFLTPLANVFNSISHLLGMNEFLSYGAFYNLMAEHFCALEAPGQLCENLIFAICGSNEASLNVSRIPVYVGHHPAGTSVQNIAHFAQMAQKETFQRFDLGSSGNRKKYGQSTPPVYDIGSITVPIAMFHGTVDWLVVPDDIYTLEAETSNLVFKKEIPHWEHLDFMWAMDAPELCYQDVIRLFKERL